MSNINTVKTITKFVVGVGTTKIVNTIIKNNAVPVKTVDRVTIYAGSMVLGGMVADAARTYTDAKIDEYVESWNKIKKAISEAKSTQN